MDRQRNWQSWREEGDRERGHVNELLLPMGKQALSPQIGLFHLDTMRRAIEEMNLTDDTWHIVPNFMLSFGQESFILLKHFHWGHTVNMGFHSSLSEG